MLIFDHKTAFSYKRFKSDDTINSKGFSASYTIIDQADNKVIFKREKILDKDDIFNCLFFIYLNISIFQDYDYIEKKI